MKNKLSKIVVLLVIVTFALTGCLGGSDIINGDNNDLNGEWSVYNNDILSIDYLDQWHYVEKSDEEGQSVIFSPEYLENDDFNLDKDLIVLYVNIINYEYIINDIDNIDENEMNNPEELLEAIKKDIEKRISDNEEENIEMESISIDNQNGFMVKGVNEAIFLEEIYYDLDLIKNDIPEINDIMINYQSEEEFINNVTIEELEDVKVILNNNEENFDNLLEYINLYIELGTTEVYVEGNNIYTYYENDIINIHSEGLKETYDNNREIIERMIDSIEFK